MNSILREDWVEIELIKLAKFIDYRGRTPKKTDVGIPLITAKNVRMGFVKEEPREYIAEIEYENWMTRGIPKKGDVLFTTEAPMGYVAQLLRDDKIALAQRLITFQPVSEIDKSFLKFNLMSPYFQAILNAQGTGTTVKGIKAAKLKLIEIRVAPLPEQRAIVAKIETLFTSLDQGGADLKKAQEQLKVYRQAVLKKAFEGELTKEWRERQPQRSTLQAKEILKEVELKRGNLNGKSLKFLQLKKDELADLFDLPAEWQWTSTGNLASNESNSICAGPFGTIFKAKDFREEGIPIIFLRHVKPNQYNTNRPGFMDQEIWEEMFHSYSVFGGELLITKLGEPPGVCAVYPTDIGPAMVTPDVIKMSVNEEVVSKKFLMYYFNSILSKRQYEKAAFGTTRLRVTIPIFRKLPVPFCSIEEQHQIVKEIESRLSVCDQMEKTIQESLDKAEALRQSILKKAFEGNLLSTEEIEACKQAPDYEPGGQLLERIKKEKAEA